MKKYLRRFKTDAEYQTFINDEENFLLPNVSYVEDTATSYFNDKEEVIPAIIYAKYNATAENMRAFGMTNNIKSLKIDGVSIDVGTPEAVVTNLNLVAENIVIDATGNRPFTCPNDYLMSFSESDNITSCYVTPTNSEITNNDFNAIAILVVMDGVSMTQFTPVSVFANEGTFPYIVADKKLIFPGVVVAEMASSAPFGMVFAKIDEEGKLVNLIDTTITYTTVTSSTLTSPYMFETEGIHEVEVELCDKTSFGQMFVETCVQEVNIPGTVYAVDYMAFYPNANLISVTLNSGIRGIGMYSFHTCSNLGTLVLPDTLAYIGVFGCSATNLTELVLPDSMTEVGMYAFYGNPFTKITLNEGLETIGANSFGACQYITEITIPESVTTIKSAAFANCPSLASVYCKSITPPSITIGEAGASGWEAFDDNAEGRKIYVPMESVDAYKSADGWSDYTDTIEGYNF